MNEGREAFRALSDAMDKAESHPESDLLQRLVNQRMASWLTQMQQSADADLPVTEQLHNELDTAAATVSEVARREGQRALDAGDLATAAAHWRMVAVLDNRENAEFLAEALGESVIMLRLIELYLQMNRPNLALAWCTIAAAEGWTIEEVHPFMHRALQMISSERG